MTTITAEAADVNAALEDARAACAALQPRPGPTGFVLTKAHGFS